MNSFKLSIMYIKKFQKKKKQKIKIHEPIFMCGSKMNELSETKKEAREKKKVEEVKSETMQKNTEKKNSK